MNEQLSDQPKEIENEISTEKFEGTIRNIELEDLDQIKPIFKTWIKLKGKVINSEVEDNLKMIKESLEKKDNERAYFVAENQNGEIVGIMGFHPPQEKMKEFASTEKETTELDLAYVAESQRRKGAGKALVSKIKEEAKKRGYKEIILNSGPRYKDTGWGFYDKIGFIRSNIAKDFYGKGIDAQTWKKNLE